MDEIMDEALRHLLDGREVRLPFAFAGHVAADSEEASPVVESLLQVLDVPHPLLPDAKLVVITLGDGRLYGTTAGRMAHASGCPSCDEVWADYRGQIEALDDDGAMITGGYTMESSQGPVMILLDARDMPDEAFEDVDG